MPVFTYRGVNRTGNTVSGERLAESKVELTALLPPGADKRQQSLRKRERIQYSHHFGTGVDCEGVGDLHSPILGDD